MALFSFPVLIVFLGWLGYGLLHSLLASSAMKNMVEKHLTFLFKRYRLLYVIFAVLIPLPLLFFQLTSKSPEIWTNYREVRLAGGVMAGMGLAVLRKTLALYDMSLFFGLKPEDAKVEPFNTHGLLAKMRHPMYTATLMIFWGWFLFSNTYQNLAFCTANTIYILIGIYWEEKKLLKLYGQKYEDYKKKTPMLIPRLRNPNLS
ncbi:isoprenylcysteine carboxylmethyltransferase family protein [uncultured Arcticibacterium sp.]|uniref:methyltransferase family protein n=1 Tax=uncultured Arcticibacterium sp. TaxID=2173042 RepID=UPI0030FAC2DD